MPNNVQHTTNNEGVQSLLLRISRLVRCLLTIQIRMKIKFNIFQRFIIQYIFFVSYVTFKPCELLCVSTEKMLLSIKWLLKCLQRYWNLHTWELLLCYNRPESHMKWTAMSCFVSFINAKWSFAFQAKPSIFICKKNKRWCHYGKCKRGLQPTTIFAEERFYQCNYPFC